MFAVEFKATVKNGAIEIPKRFCSEISDSVKVIVLMEHRKKRRSDLQAADAVSSLLTHPLHLPGFTPLSREECHERH